MTNSAINPSSEAARRRVKERHPNWGRASAHRLKRILVDAGGAKKTLVDFLGDFAEQCDAGQVFEEAPNIPAAGASMSSSFPKQGQTPLPCSSWAGIHRIRSWFRFVRRTPWRRGAPVLLRGYRVLAGPDLP